MMTSNATPKEQNQQPILAHDTLAQDALTHDEIRQFSPTADCLANKTILVTGAGDGIGRVAALTYAKHGATVLLLGKTLSKLESVYDEIEAAGAKEAAILPMDLQTAKYSDMQQLANLIQTEIGQLDGLLHNASILGALTPLEMYDPITFEQVMQVNTHAPFMLTQVLLPLLKTQNPNTNNGQGPDKGNGSIVFTTSSVGSHPRAFWGAYALSKQALEGMSDIFTQETRNTTGLRFNCINPGATRTNMRAHAYPGENPMTLKTPEDLMGAYVGLMSDATHQVRGEVIHLQPKK